VLRYIGILLGIAGLALLVAGLWEFAKLATLWSIARLADAASLVAHSYRTGTASLVLFAFCLYLTLPRSSVRQRCVGAIVGAFALVMLITIMPFSSAILQRFVFWTLAAVAIVAAIMAISVRSAVYTAIWFAISLMGVAGLFLFQGAQFLGVVTLVVYAGAIVVMFLFVVMLAQPDGHSVYDRISWGSIPKVLAVTTSTLVLAVLVSMMSKDRVVEKESNVAATAQLANPVLAEAHTANLGRELFSRHLVTVELAGTLLLAALVGAVAIVIHGKAPRAATGGPLP
jgi:NADH-quinone oxidoreductase subunit J